jgi:hypothetical protein
MPGYWYETKFSDVEVQSESKQVTSGQSDEEGVKNSPGCCSGSL